MNLSQRLDKAREQRGTDSVEYKLRSSVDHKTYDGTDLRTGEALTEETWARSEDDAALPVWNPDRANEAIDMNWRLEFTNGTTTVNPTPAVASSEIRQYADRSRVHAGRPVRASNGAARGPVCATCGGEGSVIHLDLLENTAQLQCGSCGVKWNDRAMAYAPKAR